MGCHVTRTKAHLESRNRNSKVTTVIVINIIGLSTSTKNGFT